MCLALPGKIEEIDGDNAIIDYGGVKKSANISFLENIKIGDFILVHVGFAIEKVNKEKAEGMYNLFSNE
jgi:hydrogenase expression/formation protein HypC